MSENKYSDDELVEPEGFWRHDAPYDEEPTELSLFTPDASESPTPEPPSEPPFEYEVPVNSVHFAAPGDEAAPADEPAPPFNQVAEREAPAAAAPYENELDSDVFIQSPQVDERLDSAPPAEDTDIRTWFNEPPLPSDAEREPAYTPDADERAWNADAYDQAPSPGPLPAGHDQGRASAEPTAQAYDTWQGEAPTPHDPFSTDPFAAKVAEDYWSTKPADDPHHPANYIPETPEENIRRSGLAWSAGIAFFGSVAFMLFLGWLADLLLGTTPWGMVGGIVLGSIIGFIQFFRISSQIYGSNDKSSDFRPLLSRHDDENPPE